MSEITKSPKTQGKRIGGRIIGVRANSELHAKIGRIVAHTGADKSTIIRTAINWMSEEQITAIVAANCGQGAVCNAP